MILHLIDSQGMYGAEKVVIMLLRQLMNTDFKCTLGCIRERKDEIPAIAVEAGRLGIPLHFFTMKRGFNPIGVRQINDYINYERIKMIHSHGYKGDIYSGLLHSRNVIKISTVHGWSQETEGLRMRIYEYINRKMLLRMDKVIAVSYKLQCELTSLGLSNNKIRLIYNGIDVIQTKKSEDWASLRQQFGIPPEAILLGAVGRLENIKGHLYLLEAIKILRGTNKMYHLAIAGDGPLREELTNYIHRHHLESCVTLLGFVERIHDFLSMIDVYIMPSLSEGMPLALLEAMSYSKPVVASAVGGINEVITHDKNGILVSPADSDRLAIAIQDSLRDATRMAKIGTEGYRTIEERFTSQVMVQNYINLYSETLQE